MFQAQMGALQYSHFPRLTVATVSSSQSLPNIRYIQNIIKRLGDIAKKHNTVKNNLYINDNNKYN